MGYPTQARVIWGLMMCGSSSVRMDEGWESACVTSLPFPKLLCVCSFHLTPPSPFAFAGRGQQLSDILGFFFVAFILTVLCMQLRAKCNDFGARLLGFCTSTLHTSSVDQSTLTDGFFFFWEGGVVTTLTF